MGDYANLLEIKEVAGKKFSSLKFVFYNVWTRLSNDLKKNKDKEKKEKQNVN